ncbi:MAG: LysO family transporter [Mahellales bacterium]|jgi:hypothetical protein
MWVYLVVLVAGWAIAFLNLIPRAIENRLGKFQLVSLYFILFIMGIKIGIDDSAIQFINVLGIEALVLSIGAIAGSLVLTSVAVKTLFNKKWEKEQ